MSLPSGYLTWCHVLGLNGYHPDQFSDDERALVMAWKRERFRARWRWLQAEGYPALVRAQSGREALTEMVRADIERALAPLPSRPYTVCPCCRATLGGLGRDAVPWRALRAENGFIYGSARPAEVAAAWLERTGQAMQETAR